MAAFGADVDEVVGFGIDVGVVLDDDDGVAFIDEATEDLWTGLTQKRCYQDAGQTEKCRGIPARA